MAKVKTLSPKINQNDVKSLCMGVYMTGANTDKVSKITTSWTSEDPVGMRVLQVNWYIDEIGEVAAAGDSLRLAIMATYNNGVFPDPTTIGLICFDEWKWVSADVGINKMPYEHSLIELPLVHPASVYYGLSSTSLTNAVGGYLEIFYTLEPLTADVYNALLRQMMSSTTL